MTWLIGPRRPVDEWTEGGKRFRRHGMTVREVRRCDACDGWHAVGEACEGKVVEFGRRSGGGER
jgi:hypothetical protein